jgi:hypothetical protein
MFGNSEMASVSAADEYSTTQLVMFMSATARIDALRARAREVLD